MIYDLHNDLLTYSADCQVPPDFSIQSLGAKLSKRVVYAVWTTRLKKPVDFLRSAARLGLPFTAIEDMDFINPANLAIIDALKPAYASLTWNKMNSLAGGAHTDDGLSPRGKWVIELLAKKGVILDSAHLSRRAFFEVMAFTARKKNIPIICSHACFSGIFEHPRNLTDKQIRSIIARNGIIGLSLVPEFMGRTVAKTDDVVWQIDYFVQKFGADNLAIGTDFFGTDSPALKSYQSFGWVRRRLSLLGYPSGAIDQILFNNARSFLYANRGN